MGHLGAAQARAGRRADAAATLKDMEGLAAREYVPSSALAEIATALGDTARALDLLERALAEHDFAMATIGVVPWFKPLAGEVRFEALKAKIGLPK